ncbi:MAG TPA: xanthine dehydrogenase family protein subunit M [Polyangia bacterium]|jgi:carbon-monoxide dehydrogenase medium subunit
MLLPRFEYCSAATVLEATALVAEQPGARYFAGGTDLLPQMRTRRQVPRVVDIKRIPELGEIRDGQGGNLAIGAAVPLAAIAAHPRVVRDYPLLRDCCDVVGAYPLRHRATMAGNVCNASPAADTAVALLALDATVIARGAQGTRAVPIGQFFAGPGKTALADGELVIEIVLPAHSAGMRGSYLRLSRRRGMDLATLGVLVARAASGGAPAHRVALAAVAPTPLRVPAAEQLLDAERGPAALRGASELARAAAQPITDIRATAEYRREMVGVLALRGLQALA